MQLFRNMGRERALRLLEKLRERCLGLLAGDSVC